MNLIKTFMSIKERSWVIAMITFLLVIVILIVGYQTFKATEMATFDEFNQRQFIIAREATGAIELYIETLARAMKALSRVPGVRSFDEVTTREVLALEIRDLERLGVNDIGVLDANGILRYNATANEIEGEDFSWRKYYKELKEIPSGDSYIVQFIEFKGVDAGQKGILVAIPMFENNAGKSYSPHFDKFTGIILCTLKIDTLTSKFVARIKSSERGHAFLIDDKYNLLWGPDKFLFGKNFFKEVEGFPSFQKILKRMGTENFGTAEYSYYRFDESKSRYAKDAEENLIAYASIPLGKERWALGIWAPKEDARKLIRSAYVKQMLLISIIIIVILLGSSYALAISFRYNKTLKRDVAAKTKEFKESHQRLLIVLDSLDAIVYVSDMETNKVLFVNKHTQNLFGDVVGKICLQVFQRVESGPCDFCTNKKLLTPDGKPTGVHVWEFQNTITGKWYEIRNRAIQWVDDRMVRLEIASDITDRRQARQELKRTTDQLLALVESLPIVPFTCEAKGDLGITYISSSIKDLTGYLPTEFILDSKFWAEHIHPNDRKRVLAELPEIFERGRHSCEYSFRAADGSYKLLIDTRRLVRSQDSTISHIVGTWQDITEKRKLREMSLIGVNQPERAGLGNIIGLSQPMQEVYERISKVIEMDVKTVLILGETGTGKDLVAKTIHDLSPREKHPFTEINCANIPDNLLESELFGFEKGAFTDAKVLKKGLFEQAPMGTILLNEIGHIKLDLQAKLLRVIEERKFRRVGGVKDLDLDVRLLAATNKSLWRAVENGEFRKDLYYRIKLIPIYLSPLRDRKEDLPLLIKHILQIANREFAKNIQSISDEAEELMMQYDWPGNLREVKNVIQRAVILADEDQVQIKHLPKEITNNETGMSVEFKLPENGLSLTEVEKGLIEQALAKTGRNQMQAARLLGITRHTLRQRMKKYDLLTR